MGALFGYCGTAQPGLLERMAQLLKHRCRQGWEHCAVEQDTQRIEIGHGKNRINTAAQVIHTTQAALGYAGVFYHNSSSIQELLNRLKTGGAQVAENLEGAFVLAWSAGENFYLLRDAAGVKALYWAQTGQRLLFSSEIKALFADSQLDKKLRPAALAEYFTFSFVPGEGTMLEGVYELQPGTLLTFRNGQVSLRRWFNFEQWEWQAQDPHTTEDSVAQVRAALALSTEECLHTSAQTPGFFLSGGIDSSSVLAMAKHLHPQQTFPTFSVHFGTKYPHEQEFIDLMVRHCRTEHHLLEVRPQHFSDRLEEICWRLDDPIGDPVSMPNYLLAEFAAQHTPVVLNGEGGDPCFGGPKNIPMLLSHLYGSPGSEAADGWLERQYLHAFQRAYTDLTELLNQDIYKAIQGDKGLVALLQPFFHAAQPKHLLNIVGLLNNYIFIIIKHMILYIFYFKYSVIRL